MSQATVTVAPKSVTFGGHTWTSADGGPIEATYTYGGRELNDWTGDAMYPQTFTVDGVCNATVTLRDIKTLIEPGTRDTLAYIVTGKMGADTAKSDVSINMSDMIFIGAGPATQPRAAAGSITLRFSHDSQDGSTAPVT
jgi:hypothetical protein